MAEIIETLTQDKIYIKKMSSISDTEWNVIIARINDDSTKSKLYPTTKVDNIYDNSGKKLTDILEELKNLLI